MPLVEGKKKKKANRRISHLDDVAGHKGDARFEDKNGQSEEEHVQLKNNNNKQKKHTHKTIKKKKTNSNRQTSMQEYNCRTSCREQPTWT